MVRGLRQRYHDRFSDYFSPESLERFNEEIDGRFSGIGLERRRGQAGPAGRHRSSTARRRTRPGSSPATRSSRSTATRSPARAATAATAKIKGPEGTEVTVGVLDAKSGKVRELTPDPGRGRAAGRQQQGRRRSTGASSATCGIASFSEGVHALLRQGGREGRARRRRRDRARPARQRRRPARRGGAERRASSCPKDEVVVTTDSRTQGHAVYKTVGGNLPQAADRRPDRPQHRLGGGDPHRGARRRRRRHGGRHPLLRQGRLPAGDRPLQRRRAEADGRRVLHPRRRQPGRSHGIHPDVKASDNPRHQAATRRCERRARQVAGRPGSGERREPRARRPRRGRAAARGAGAEHAPARRSRRCSRERARPAAASAAGARGRSGEAARRERPSARSAPRRDLTELPTFTVDPATARDFDDAVSAQREGDGVRASGSTSPTSPPTCGRARRSTSRRGAAPTAPTSRARSSRCCRTR